MGLVSSRLNLDALHSGRRRSQQDEILYSYSLNKNYFSNYFLMGGERFEVNDPDYLFGDSCDLNFLSCTKPHSLPYKQAQQNLLTNLNTKQKITSKRPNCVQRLSSPLNILTGRHRRNPQTDSRKQQDAQTQTSNGSKGLQNGLSPSQPLVMFVNIRKETLRLVKLSKQYNLDSSDLNNPDSQHESSPKSQSQAEPGVVADCGDNNNEQNNEITPTRSSSPSKQSRKSSPRIRQQQQYHQQNRHSAIINSRATTSTNVEDQTVRVSNEDNVSNKLEPSNSSKRFESDVSSLLSATSSTRSGYTSVKEEGLDPSVDQRSSNFVANDNDDNDDDDDDDDEYDDFKDALNDTTNLSAKEDDDDDSEQTQQHRSLLGRRRGSSFDNGEIRVTIAEYPDDTSASNSSDIKTDPTLESSEGDENLARYSTPRASTRRLTKSPVKATDNNNSQAVVDNSSSSSRVYNIEFNFDALVDCSIRIFYFCTREITSNGINYKPQHANHESKVYYFKKGLNQKFDQQEHTFQPYLFDEDLLIYKPLDSDGKYNSGAVFPIVIHCVALEGSTPMQSHSLVATIEKSQLDDSYSIKPLKQLIFVDGVQYILQDIYGIEHKQLSSTTSTAHHRNKAPKILKSNNRSNLRVKSQSVQSNLDAGSSLNLSDTASLASVDYGGSLSSRQNRGSTVSNQHKSLGSENTFECVICMSEERDTMLLPCRHLCLCSSCAQSLRYQASSCPICRSPFKAALNLRPVQRHSQGHSGARKSFLTSSNPIVSTSMTGAIRINQDSAI